MYIYLNHSELVLQGRKEEINFTITGLLLALFMILPLEVREEVTCYSFCSYGIPIHGLHQEVLVHRFIRMGLGLGIFVWLLADPISGNKGIVRS